MNDPATQWIAGAVQIVLQTDLATSRKYIPLLADDDSGTFADGAKQVVRATVTGGGLRISVSADVTDNATQKNAEVINLEGQINPGILPLLNRLAKRLDASASNFSTNNGQALQLFINAATMPKAQGRVALLTQAVTLDPSFGLAYIALADAETQADPAAIAALLKTAAAHEAQFTPFDRARFHALELRYSHAPVAEQEAAFRAVLQIAPNQSDALAAVGTLSFLRGDAKSGEAYLGKALELNPGNVNLRRSLADGLFETRHFADAEKVLVGLDNNVSLLPELAVCVLMEGDAARANTIADRLFASIANTDVKTLFQAVWWKLSGQTPKAVEALNKTNFVSPGARAIAYSELAVWQMMDHNFAPAKPLAAKALQADPRPGSFGSTVSLLADANEAADAWRQQVNNSFFAANPQSKNTVLGYGFFLGQHYMEAADVWQTILNQSGGADLRARAMLAASLRGQGKTDQARQVNVQPFVPDFGDLYASVSFFQMNRDLGIGVR